MHMFDQTSRTNRSCLTTGWIQEIRRKDPAQKYTPPKRDPRTPLEKAASVGTPAATLSFWARRNAAGRLPAAPGPRSKEKQMNDFNKKSTPKAGSKETKTLIFIRHDTPTYGSKRNNRTYLKQKSTLSVDPRSQKNRSRTEIRPTKDQHKVGSPAATLFLGSPWCCRRGRPSGTRSEIKEKLKKLY